MIKYEAVLFDNYKNVYSQETVTYFLNCDDREYAPNEVHSKICDILHMDVIGNVIVTATIQGEWTLLVNWTHTMAKFGFRSEELHATMDDSSGSFTLIINRNEDTSRRLGILIKRH